jgi:hypothetical protein
MVEHGSQLFALLRCGYGCKPGQRRNGPNIVWPPSAAWPRSPQPSTGNRNSGQGRRRNDLSHGQQDHLPESHTASGKIPFPPVTLSNILPCPSRPAYSGVVMTINARSLAARLHAVLALFALAVQIALGSAIPSHAWPSGPAIAAVICHTDDGTSGQQSPQPATPADCALCTLCGALAHAAVPPPPGQTTRPTDAIHVADAVHWPSVLAPPAAPGRDTAQPRAPPILT